MRGRHLAAVVVALLISSTALAGAQTAPLAPSTHDPAEVRERADEILARDEFQPPGQSMLDRVGEWIADHLIPGDSDGGTSEGGGSTVGGGAASGAGSSVITVVLLVLAVVGLGWLLWTLSRAPWRRSKPKGEEVAVDIEAHRTADEWTAAAARHEAAGEWKDGLRCRFRALVERLTDRGVVPEVPGRTAGELRGDVRTSAPQAADPFAEAADLFERAWYGDLATGPDEAGRFADRAERVLTSAPDDARGES